MDTRDVNALGPGKFRTRSDSGRKETCYYNRNKTDTRFNLFLATRGQASQASKKIFLLLIDNLHKYTVIYSEVRNELNNFINDNVRGIVQQISGGGYNGRTDPATSKQELTDSARVSKKPRFLSG